MIARKSFLIVTTHFFIDFLGWVGIVILAKLWGGFAPEAIGIIGFAMSFISLFGIITDLGFSSAHVKRVSEGKDLGTCIGTFAAIKILLTGLMVACIFGAIYILKNVLNRGFYDATTESVIIVIVFHAIFTNLYTIATQTFTGKREVAKLQITMMMENIVKVPLSIIVALAGVTSMGYNIVPAIAWPEFLRPIQKFLAAHAVGSLAMTYVFGIMAVFLVGMYLLRKYPLKKPSWSLSKSYFSFALPIMLASVVGTVAHSVDSVMVGYFYASTEVGYYYTVQRILSFISVLYISVGTVLYPTISKQHSQKDISGIISTAHLSERYMSMVLIPPVLFVIVFSKPIINIMLSSAFLPAAPVLIVLVLLPLIRGLSVPYSSLIHGMNRPDIAAKIGVAVCIINIILNYAFIPKNGLLSSFGINGAIGAAVATVASFTVTFIGLRLAAKKLSGIKLLQSHTPRHIIAGIIMAGILYYIAFQIPFIDEIRWYILLGFAGLGLLIYLGVMFLLREFNKDDLNFFLDILRINEMIKYIKSELKSKPKK